MLDCELHWISSFQLNWIFEEAFERQALEIYVWYMPGKQNSFACGIKIVYSKRHLETSREWGLRWRWKHHIFASLLSILPEKLFQRRVIIKASHRKTFLVPGLWRWIEISLVQGIQKSG